MRTEPGSEIVILREDNVLLAAKVETLLKELNIAIRYCSKEYWSDGHAERARQIYGVEVEAEHGK
jgi:hypothetical protein